MIYVGAEEEWKAYLGSRCAHGIFKWGGGADTEAIYELCLILNIM
jgi:hypothetical protein